MNPKIVLSCCVALALGACARPVEPRGTAPAPGGVLESADPTPPGMGKLKLRSIYDHVGDRAGTPWAGFELNGDYNYPSPSTAAGPSGLPRWTRAIALPAPPLRRRRCRR
jgi:hypothetical protein